VARRPQPRRLIDINPATRSSEDDRVRSGARARRAKVARSPVVVEHLPLRVDPSTLDIVDGRAGAGPVSLDRLWTGSKD
jgi:hypothetical protein